jgi:hypothetical protein
VLVHSHHLEVALQLPPRRPGTCPPRTQQQFAAANPRRRPLRAPPPAAPPFSGPTPPASWRAPSASSGATVSSASCPTAHPHALSRWRGRTCAAPGPRHRPSTRAGTPWVSHAGGWSGRDGGGSHAGRAHPRSAGPVQVVTPELGREVPSSHHCGVRSNARTPPYNAHLCADHGERLLLCPHAAQPRPPLVLHCLMLLRALEAQGDAGQRLHLELLGLGAPPCLPLLVLGNLRAERWSRPSQIPSPLLSCERGKHSVPLSPTKSNHERLTVGMTAQRVLRNPVAPELPWVGQPRQFLLPQPLPHGHAEPYNGSHLNSTRFQSPRVETS